MYFILFFLSCLSCVFLVPKTFANSSHQTYLIVSNKDTKHKEEKPHQKPTEDSDETPSEEKEPENVIENYTMPDGRTVLRIKNGMNEQRTMIQKDETGAPEEIIKSFSAKSRPLVHTPVPSVIAGGDYRPSKKPEEESEKPKQEEESGDS